MDRIGIVSLVEDVRFSEVARVSAAIQQQIKTDVGPIWQVDATVDAFAKLDDLPEGCIPVAIVAKLANEAFAGFHKTANGQPYAFVRSSSVWSLDASHECIEILLDPTGDRFRTGPSLKPIQGDVNYLQEACDPCGRGAGAYRIADTIVADFCFPEYYTASSGISRAFSKTERLQGPRTLLAGGYLTWFDTETQQWWQADRFGSSISLGKIQPPDVGNSLRERIDSVSSDGRSKCEGKGERRLKKLLKECGQARRKACARAEAMRAEFSRWLADK